MAPGASGKPLGSPRGALNMPIVAATAAVLVGVWSFTSIRSARRESAPDMSSPNVDANSGGPPRSYREPLPKIEQPEWMQQALKESRETQK